MQRACEVSASAPLCAPQTLPGLLRQKAYRKRTAGRLRLHFPGGAGFQIAVGLYALLQPAVKGGPTFLNTNNFQPLQVESALVCQDTGDPASLRMRLLLISGPCDTFASAPCEAIAVELAVSEHRTPCLCGAQAA